MRYGPYTALTSFGVGFVLVPRLPLFKVILISQVANGIPLPFVLTFMLLLVHRPRFMGEYRTRPWANLVARGISVITIVLTLALLWTSVSDSPY